MTNIVGGTICALIAGLLGSALWAGIVYGAGVEIGWIAWGIGAAVGFGASFGSKGGGMGPAVMAVLITVAAIALGKFMAVNLMMRDAMGEMEFSIMSDEDAIHRIASELESADPDAEPVSDEAYDDEDLKNDFSGDYWAKAEADWNSKSDAEKQDFKDKDLEMRKEMVNKLAGAVRQEGFANSWGPMDIIFVLLGVYTAFQIAFSDPIDD